ncbi:MAG: antitoxin [Thermoleophilaceae bacterium]
MRTTVTLEADTEALLKRLMRERDLSFKQAINEAVRRGLTSPQGERERFRTRTYDMGVKPGVNLDKALRLAGELEDAEIVRKLRLGK